MRVSVFNQSGVRADNIAFCFKPVSATEQLLSVTVAIIP